jgi:hypothetical protein
MKNFTSLAVVALLLWLNLRRHETGLTEGEIIYSDVDDGSGLIVTDWSVGRIMWHHELAAP